MKKMQWILAIALVVVAMPAFSAQPMQMWSCEMEDGTTEEDVTAGAKEWLEAAKKMDGGENLKVQIFFPVAVNATGTTDFLFVVTVPTFAEWGKFWDAYIEHPEGIDTKQQDKVICPDSALWEAVKIK